MTINCKLNFPSFLFLVFFRLARFGDLRCLYTLSEFLLVLILHDAPVCFLLARFDVDNTHVFLFFNALLEIFQVPADNVMVEAASVQVAVSEVERRYTVLVAEQLLQYLGRVKLPHNYTAIVTA